VFERLQEKHRIRVVLVGARPEAQMQFGAVPVEVLPWSEETEANKIASFDIGVMPLPDSPWERGKCGYKLIQYMASAKPVVASPVGVNTTIVKDCACGFLATGDDEWFEALDVLLNERKKRVEFGERGRRAVENYYSLQAQSRPLAHIFHRVAGTHLSPSN
jgi:glycosyltransferase involved in cell wall biosynthesis